MSIDIIIPNYNGFDLLKNNLPKVVTEAKRYGAGIIIVDDYSDAQEFKDLSQLVGNLHKHYPIEVLRNEKNLGFSSSINRGVRKSKADLVVLLNTDVVPENEFLNSALLDFKNNPNLFGEGFMDKSREGGKTVLRGRGVASWVRGFLVHSRGEVNKDDTFWISGGSCIIKRDLFEELGGFDPLYNPFYWEDIDLSYRARKSGYELKFNSACVVEHKHEEGSIKKSYGDFEIKTIAYRNQIIFVWKNISDPGLLLSHLVWLPYHKLYALFRFDLAFFLGLAAAISKIPVIIGHRSRQEKLYKKKDHDLI